MSYIGTNKIGKMYLGGTAIGKAYLGSDLVYDSAGGGVTPSYTALNYIKFTGSQWILTDYHPNPNTHLVIDMQFEQKSSAGSVNRWIDVYNNTVGYFVSNFGGSSNQYGELFYWFGDATSTLCSKNYGTSIYNRSTFTYKNSKVTFQGSDTTTQSKANTQDGYLTLGYAASTGDTFNRHNLIIYSMKIYENNVLLHEYLPKTDGTNNGLYDTVTDTFITSQTATNLIGE